MSTGNTRTDGWSARTNFIMQTVINATIPRGGAFAAGAADYDLLTHIHQIVRTFEPSTAKAIPLLLAYVEFSCVLYTGHRLTRLNEERAAQFLTGMEDSTLFYRRKIVQLLKLLGILAFYDIDEVAANIGYQHHQDCPAPTLGADVAPADFKSIPVCAAALQGA